MGVGHVWELTFRNEVELIHHLHFLAKVLVGQSIEMRGLINKFIGSVKSKKKSQAMPKLKQLLRTIENILYTVETRQTKGAAWAARVQELQIKHLRDDVRDEAFSLFRAFKLPKTKVITIQKKIRQVARDMKDEIDKEAVIGVEVKRGRTSLTLMSKGAIISFPRVPRREKRYAFNAGEVLKDVNRIHDQLLRDKNPPIIDKIARDLVQEAEGYEKIAHYMFLYIEFCLLYMEDMRKQIHNLKTATEKFGKNNELIVVEERMHQTWKGCMNRISLMLQQLRFSVAPEEMDAAAAA